MIKVAFNGMGRIGRAAFKIALDTPGIKLAAVNDLMPVENLAYLLRFDTVYGRYGKKIETGSAGLMVDGSECRVLREKDPSRLPWKDMDVDVVFECTGAFTKREDLEKHIRAGAKSVILSAPAKGEDVITVVHGVNRPGPEVQVISCASCTTNCITPVVEVMGRRIGVKKATMTTIHAYTATQSIVDGPNRQMRRGRAGAANFVPTSSGAAIATTRALPEFAGKFDGAAVRAPIPAGSLADIVFVTERQTTREEVNGIFVEEADGERYRGVLGVTENPAVSSDVVGDPRASIVDLEMTQVVDGDLVKVMSWYDNEWGYASQMIKEAVRMFKTR